MVFEAVCTILMSDAASSASKCGPLKILDLARGLSQVVFDILSFDMPLENYWGLNG